MKPKKLSIRVTEEQDKILTAKARPMGFTNKADYIRFIIFMPVNFQDMIKEIHEKVIKNDRV